MKVNLYLDVYNPALNATMVNLPLYATSNPQPKPIGARRFKITVDIPSDEQLFAGKIDGVLPIDEKIKEVDRDADQ